MILATYPSKISVFLIKPIPFSSITQYVTVICVDLSTSTPTSGIDKHPSSSDSTSSLLVLITGLMNSELKSLYFATKTLKGTPICVDAKPTPLPEPSKV